ncbi:unnamed protein product [Vicia faba]|uniref:Uncharacterized protein n=1 Tax=Vicia faba TaxID=3906 RepID=A0AAV1AMJ4_VICFA|nr:unnamed protein product [Vicia faba]
MMKTHIKLYSKSNSCFLIMTMKSSLAIILLVLFHIVGLVVSDPPPYHANESSPSYELSAVTNKPPKTSPKKSPPPPYRRSPPPPPPHSEKPFDFLMLAEIWPETYCIMMNQVCRKITPSKFVIHGLWPSNSDIADSQPRNCHNTTEPDISSFSFKKDLQKEWPSLRSYQNTSVEDTTLWMRQWNYHGTCSLMTPEKYFEETIKIHKRVNLKFTLNKAGLPPTNRRPHQLSNIFSAIKNRIGFKPQIQCYQIHNTFYLREIRVCVDKSTPHGYIDCPRDYVDCGSNVVYFPEKE